MNRESWERNELAELAAQLRDVDNQSLADRKTACIEWQRDLANPSLIAQRVQWLLMGNYGHGAMVKAIEMAKTRGNAAAQLGGLIAAVEWRCPNREARAAWNRLSQAQQVAVNEAIAEEVKDWVRDNADSDSSLPEPRLSRDIIRGNPYAEDLSILSIDAIARIISRDWKNVNYGAKPYLDAMFQLTAITDNYYNDSGASIVSYFLSNASSWKGETAKAVKAELKRRLTVRRNPMTSESFYQTWEGWKRAVKKAGALYIDGNKDIAQAFKSRILGKNGYWVGDNAIGDWDGVKGYVAVKEVIRRNPHKPKKGHYASVIAGVQKSARAASKRRSSAISRRRQMGVKYLW